MPTPSLLCLTSSMLSSPYLQADPAVHQQAPRCLREQPQQAGGRTDLDGKSIEDTITAVAGNTEKAGVFNNAAQVWNHSFYWQCIKAGGGGQPTGALADEVN